MKDRVAVCVTDDVLVLDGVTDGVKDGVGVSVDDADPPVVILDVPVPVFEGVILWVELIVTVGVIDLEGVKLGVRVEVDDLEGVFEEVFVFEYVADDVKLEVLVFELVTVGVIVIVDDADPPVVILDVPVPVFEGVILWVELIVTVGVIDLDGVFELVTVGVVVLDGVLDLVPVNEVVLDGVLVLVPDNEVVLDEVTLGVLDEVIVDVPVEVSLPILLIDIPILFEYSSVILADFDSIIEIVCFWLPDIHADDVMLFEGSIVIDDKSLIVFEGTIVIDCKGVGVIIIVKLPTLDIDIIGVSVLTIVCNGLDETVFV